MMYNNPTPTKPKATKATEIANSKEPLSKSKPLKAKRKKRGRKKKPPAPPEPIELVDDARPMDILHGRGLPYHSNPGNTRLKEIVAKKKQAYKDAEKAQKKGVIMSVMSKIQENQPHPVRFLKRLGTGHNARWRLATKKEAYKKVSHALREKDKIIEEDDWPKPVTEGTEDDNASVLTFDSSFFDRQLLLGPSVASNNIRNVTSDILHDSFVGGEDLAMPDGPLLDSLWIPRVPRVTVSTTNGSVGGVGDDDGNFDIRDDISLIDVNLEELYGPL